MDNPWRILHITDCHLHGDPEARLRGVKTDHTLVATLKQALNDPNKPEGILATGDLVQDESRAGYERFRALTGTHGLPVYCLPGNHDNPALMQELLSVPPFQFGGVVHRGNWSLVLLNTWTANDVGGRLAPMELGLLEQVLTNPQSENCLIALHHHPLPMGSTWLDTVGLRNADEFLDLCDRSDRVRGIVWGHVHQDSDQERRGVRLLSTPSTCSQFKPLADQFATDASPPAYRWLDLHPDGRLTTALVWVE